MVVGDRQRVGHLTGLLGNRHAGRHDVEIVGERPGRGHLVEPSIHRHLLVGPSGGTLHGLVVVHGLGARTTVTDRGRGSILVHIVLPVLTLGYGIVGVGWHETLLLLTIVTKDGGRVGSSMVNLVSGRTWTWSRSDGEVVVRGRVCGRGRVRRVARSRSMLGSSCFGRGLFLSRGLVDVVGYGYVYAWLVGLVAIGAGTTPVALDLSDVVSSDCERGREGETRGSTHRFRQYAQALEILCRFPGD